MLIKTIITLLSLSQGSNAANFNQYDLARLQLSGLLDDENNLTPHGHVIVQEILTYAKKVL